MEIRPSSELGLPDLLNEAVRSLEENVDKTVIESVEIRTQDECESVALAMLEDKRQIGLAKETLGPFKSLAYRIHQAISAKENEYTQYGKSRYAVRERAVSDWTLEQERKQAEEEKRLRELATAQEEQRRKEEAAELERRAKAEKRPDLKQRAEEVRNEPVREVSVSLGSRRSSAPAVKGFGMRDEYVITVTDEEALTLAIGRRAIYIEVAKAIAAKFGKKKSSAIIDAVAWLMEQANDMPQIPTNVVKPNESAIKANAKATNGKINWPGVAIEVDRKARTRTK